MIVKLKFLEDSEANVWSRFQPQIYADLVNEGNVRVCYLPLQFYVFMLFLVNKFCSISDYNRSHDKPSGNMEWSQSPSSPKEPSLLQGGAPD